MDGHDDDRTGWLIDGLAAGLLGIAVGASLLLLGWPKTAVGVAPVVVLAALTMLRRVKPAPRRFRLPAFAVEAFAPAAEPLDSSDVADAGPLELVDLLPPASADSRVVQLFAARALPTPGELARRIDHHLGASEERVGGTILELEVDAAAALRQALGELRRSLA